MERRMKGVLGGDSRPPNATIITRDFSLAGGINRSGVARVARVVAEADGDLLPLSEGEILMIAPDSPGNSPAEAMITRWLDGFDMVVYLDGEGEPPAMPAGVVRADLDSLLDDGSPAEGEAPAKRMDRRASPSIGRPITVVIFNPKGGVGKTTLSVSVAHRVLARTGCRVGLLDLDVAGGDVGSHLGISEAPTLMDAAAYGEDVTPELVAELVTRHRGQLDVLPSPGRPELVELAAWERVEPTMDAMRRCYDVLVVDTGSGGVSHLAHMAAREAHMLVCPVCPDPTSLDRLLPILGSVPDLSERVRPVLNRFAPGSRMGEGQVEEVLGIRPATRIPDLGSSVSNAVAAGIPLLESEPESPLGVAVDELVSEVFGVDISGRSDGSLWRRLKEKIFAKGVEVLDG